VSNLAVPAPAPMAAVAPQFRRSADLYSLPAAANAVAWSEDNLLAVATGRSVILLNPAALGGPRGVIDVPFTQPTAAEGQPSGRLADHLAFLISSVGRGPKPELRKSSTVRAVAWSPTGCGAGGGCLLAIVTQDHKARRLISPAARAIASGRPRKRTSHVLSYIAATWPNGAVLCG